MQENCIYQGLIGLKKVAVDLDKDFLCVDTNINEFLMQLHEETHTFRTLAIPLLFQKYFAKYYFSSGFPFEKFYFDVDDTAAYDLLNVACLSTESLQFYLSGGEANRMEKLHYIAEYPITYNNLNVCISEISNCSRCVKCERTMLGLYLIDKLELYKDVFDLDLFYKNKKSIFSNAVRYKEKPDWDLIYIMLKEKGLLNIEEILLGNLKRFYDSFEKRVSDNKILKTIYRFVKKCYRKIKPKK